MRYWKRVNEFGDTTTVESYSHNLNVKDAREIDKTEYRAFIASLPPSISAPPRDYGKEIDAINQKLRISGVIE